MKFFLIIFTTALVLSACSDKKTQVEDATLKGLYQSSSPKLIDSGTHFFFITANLDFYALVKRDAAYYRVWRGTISYDAGQERIIYEYDEHEQEFISGEIIGKKLDMSSQVIPEQLRAMVQVNETAYSLRTALSESEILLEFRLSLEEPAFKINQKELIEGLTENSDILIELMKIKKLQEIRITDGTQTEPYIQKNRLYLPAGSNKNTNEVLDQLRN